MRAALEDSEPFYSARGYRSVFQMRESRMQGMSGMLMDARGRPIEDSLAINMLKRLA